jgi:hypothetical protein
LPLQSCSDFFQAYHIFIEGGNSSIRRLQLDTNNELHMDFGSSPVCSWWYYLDTTVKPKMVGRKRIRPSDLSGALLEKQVVSGAPYLDSKCATVAMPPNFNSMAHFGMRHIIKTFLCHICATETILICATEYLYRN